MQNNTDTLYILASESTFGIHSKTTNEKIEVVSFNVPINIKEINGKYIPYSNLDNNASFLQIKSLLEEGRVKYSDVFLLVGFDLDVKGEMMAHTLRNVLLEKNIIPSENIIRTPLTEDGYVSFIDFLNIDEYAKFIYLQKKFINMQKEDRIGFRKMMSLNVLSDTSGKEISLENPNIFQQGNSTYTAIWQHINAEVENDQEDEECW